MERRILELLPQHNLNRRVKKMTVEKALDDLHTMGITDTQINGLLYGLTDEQWEAHLYGSFRLNLKMAQYAAKLLAHVKLSRNIA